MQDLAKVFASLKRQTNLGQEHLHKGALRGIGAGVTAGDVETDSEAGVGMASGTTKRLHLGAATDGTAAVATAGEEAAATLDLGASRLSRHQPRRSGMR
jgi:hypothetical protein